MTDVYGVLSDEEQEQAIAWIKKHWSKGEVCPICGSQSWEMPQHVVMLSAGSPGLVIGGAKSRQGPGRAAYPQVMLICSTCGHTILFNALTIGLTVPGLLDGNG